MIPARGPQTEFLGTRAEVPRLATGTPGIQAWVPRLRYLG